MDMNSPLETYEIKETIGKGGGGTVMLAFHKRLQKKVIIKQIHDFVNINDRRTEVDILKNLKHSYLPQVYDYFVIDGISYTVMEYIEGVSLQKLLNEGRKFKESQVIKYGKQLCEAVEYLHSQRIPVIHGDIKPDNIMLTPEDNICLIDFNISGISEGKSAYTTGCSRGYSAPEQMEAFFRISNAVKSGKAGLKSSADFSEETEVYTSEETEVYSSEETQVFDEAGAMAKPVSKEEDILKIPIDKQTDVYSIGATLYHLYTGIRLDKADNKVLKANTSEGYLYILNKALSINPKDRFASAGEMLKALNNIYKKEKKYKMMIASQAIVRVVLFLFMIVGIGLCSYGYQRMKLEKSDLYDDYIVQLEGYAAGDSYEEFQETYDLAVSLFPDREEAYYQRARFLFVSKKYEEDIDYIEQIHSSGSILISSETNSRLYYIEGNSFYALDLYEEAADSFEKAIQHDSNDGNIYTDYAISLAKIERTSDAKNALASAEEHGAEKSFIYLAKGEIEYAEGNYSDAENSLKQSIEYSQDDYKKMRAYSTCAKAMMKDNTIENIDKTISFLDEGILTVGLEYRSYLINILADACGTGYSISGDSAYAEKAIDNYKALIDTGWANISTFNNVIILCSYLENTDLALSFMEQMQKDYSENYITAKRMAFLELEIQNQKDEKDRDYSKFVEYYNDTKSKYEEQSKGKTDPEVQLLDQDYQKLIDGNWIEGE